MPLSLPEFLCQMAASPALTLTVLLTLAVLLVNGWISKKIRPDLRRLYEQIPNPKWVVAMGECAISGGPWYDSYNTVQGLDQIVPVDVYIPGCPARPDAMIDGFMLLQKKIESYFRRGAFLED